VDRIQVLLPVPRGPNRKKAVRGRVRDRVNIEAKFTVKMVLVSTGE